MILLGCYTLESRIHSFPESLVDIVTTEPASLSSELVTVMFSESWVLFVSGQFFLICPIWWQWYHVIDLCFLDFDLPLLLLLDPLSWIRPLVTDRPSAGLSILGSNTNFWCSFIIKASLTFYTMILDLPYNMVLQKLS